MLLANVWGHLVPVGGYAWRLNLLSATCSAAAAGFLFLVAHHVLRGERPWLRLGGAAAAALLAAFTFTAWQSSNETEVYMVTVLSICATCWLCLRWRDARGTLRAPHLLLVIVYLAGLAVGTHLMGLLVGPAAIAFVAYVLGTAPAPDPVERRHEWVEWGGVASLFVMLVGVGLGNTAVLALGGLGLAAVVVFALATAPRAAVFPAVGALVAAVGVSTYAFLYIRSGLDPVIDMADPETWDRLVAVIRREQYPPRGLFDDPRFLSGPDNPGRSPLLVAHQLVMYGQYFGWQWGRSLGTGGVAVAGIYLLLGAFGMAELKRGDRGTAVLLGALWLITGLGMVAYMNFRPGFSLFWDIYPTMDEHEVRERDYFFTVSFQTWGVFAGFGLVAAVRLIRKMHERIGRAAGAVLALGAVPFVFNFSAATRRGPDATLARDFAYNMLQSVQPYGILFTYGDNDTYPLWYAQEVEGVRQDVALINLSLAQTDWYVDQLPERPQRPFRPEAAPAMYSVAGVPPPPEDPLFDPVTAQLQPYRLDRAVDLNLQGIAVRLHAGQVLYLRDQVILLALRDHLGRRPVTFGISSGRGSWLGLDSTLVLEGLVYRVVPGDPADVPGAFPGIQGLAVDMPRTQRLVDSVFHYGRLFDVDALHLGPDAAQVTGSMSLPLVELAQWYGSRGDDSLAVSYLRRAHHLAPNPNLARVIERIMAEGGAAVFGRTAEPGPSP